MVQKTARVIEGIKPDRIPFEELFTGNEPVIMRGMITDWPLIQAGLESPEAAMDYLASGYSGKKTGVYIGDPGINGHFYYDKTCTALNYHVENISLLDMFAKIKEGIGQATHPYYYSPSLFYPEGFPGLQSENRLILDHANIQPERLVAKIWIGTKSITSAHYDMPNNIACCVVGRRRFTLFPPNQIHNMYPGPFTPTPGGQVMTMVDIRNPDLDTYPRFKEALDASVVADLEPGDVLYYPSMWWHEVEAKDSFNTLINYWWYSNPFYMGSPMDTLMNGILAIRDRPEKEKQAWRELFDYYVFGDPDKPRAHLPEACHGVLGPLDETMARKLRALLQHALNK